MPGEIDTSDARESAISRVLNRRDAAALSCGEMTSHSLRPAGRVIAPDIRGLTELGVGVSSLVSTLAYLGTLQKVVCCFESDLVLLNSYLD